jgi:hypothetical protein
MAQRIEVLHVTAAAGVAKAAPVTVALPFTDGVIHHITVIVPRGPSGLSGFQLRYDGVQQIPRTAGEFIVTDDEKIGFDVEGYPTGSHWQLTTYNTDIYSHTYEVRFLLDEITRVTPSAVTFLPIQQADQPTSSVEDVEPQPEGVLVP